MKKLSYFLVLLTSYCLAQEIDHTEDNRLRGSITPQRQWWDLNYYHLDVTIDIEKKFITGKNTIRYKVLESKKVLQVDLQPPLRIHKITQGKRLLNFERVGTNAYFVKLRKRQKKGAFFDITVHYSGHPKEAKDAPWDGGFSWKKDSNGNPFVATSCQIEGASLWWPCKDHFYDEADSMLISTTVPKNLMNVSNGRLRMIEKNNDSNTTHWFVSNPINNYTVNINIGDYVNFEDTYKGEKGNLHLSYWVLRNNLEKAKKHFEDVPKMLEAFEHWFGPYPFYEDSFKLVDVPYLGMEHQSSLTYGNRYKNGYLGTDLSKTGWGLKFDFIIIHESAHEWFGNNITYNDFAYYWIHESFTTYAESLYVEYHFGKQAGAEYVLGTRHRTLNDIPIMGIYGRNKKGSDDAYYKGANMLHTLRHYIDDDEKWRQALRGLNKVFFHKTVSTKEIETYLSEKVGIDLTAFFNQYLRTTSIPILEYVFDKKELKFRYVDTTKDFNMPLRIFIDGEPQWIYPRKNGEWKTIELKGREVVFDKNFYVTYKEVEPLEMNSTTE